MITLFTFLIGMNSWAASPVVDCNSYWNKRVVYEECPQLDNHCKYFSEYLAPGLRKSEVNTCHYRRTWKTFKFSPRTFNTTRDPIRIRSRAEEAIKTAKSEHAGYDQCCVQEIKKRASDSNQSDSNKKEKKAADDAAGLAN